MPFLWILPTGSLVAEGVSRRRHVLDEGLNHLGFSGSQGVGALHLCETGRVARRRAEPSGRRVETLERAAHARSVATAKGRRLGRPTVIDTEQLDYASHLRDTGHTINEIVAKTGITPHQPVPASPAP